MSVRFLTVVALTASIAFSTGAIAQQAAPQAPAASPPPLPEYGPAITLAQAKRVAAAAAAEIPKSGYAEAIAIVEPSGELVYFERFDGTNYGSLKLAILKAQTAARFRRPSQVFEDLLHKGVNLMLGLTGVTPIGGGEPIMSKGKIIGAIGISGAPISEPDVVVAKAGAAAIK